jgi:hypothetical protein
MTGGTTAFLCEKEVFVAAMSIIAGLPRHSTLAGNEPKAVLSLVAHRFGNRMAHVPGGDALKLRAMVYDAVRGVSSGTEESLVMGASPDELARLRAQLTAALLGAIWDSGRAIDRDLSRTLGRLAIEIGWRAEPHEPDRLVERWIQMSLIFGVSPSDFLQVCV